MLALEAALVSHGSPLPAAAGSATAVSTSGPASLETSPAASTAAAGVSLQSVEVDLADNSGVRVAAGNTGRRLYRQAYCPEVLLTATVEQALSPGGAKKSGKRK